LSFTCPRCGATSYHPEDERNGYCGKCHSWTALKAGDVLRVRRRDSEDVWCICQVLLASSNGLSLVLRIADDAALRTRDGGLMMGKLCLAVDPDTAIVTELFTCTELEVEGRV
jgi:hypothetical protein